MIMKMVDFLSRKFFVLHFQDNVQYSFTKGFSFVTNLPSRLVPINSSKIFFICSWAVIFAFDEFRLS